MPAETISKGYLQVPADKSPPTLLYVWTTATVVTVVRVIGTGKDRVAQAVRDAAAGATPGIYRAKVVFGREAKVTRTVRVAAPDEIAKLTQKATMKPAKKGQATAREIREARAARALADGLRAHALAGSTGEQEAS